MGKNLYEQEPVFRDTVDRCADILEPILGQDLRSKMYPPDGDSKAAEEFIHETFLSKKL